MAEVEKLIRLDLTEAELAIVVEGLHHIGDAALALTRLGATIGDFDAAAAAGEALKKKIELLTSPPEQTG